MPRPALALALALSLGSCDCGSRAPTGIAPSATAAPSTGAGAGERGPSRERPRLVLSIVFDQLGSNVLRRHEGLLSRDGVIQRALHEGAAHRRVVYPYAATYTAPGHAAIYSGAPPAESGVLSNNVWDAVRSKKVAAVDDGRHAVFGHEGRYASPSVLRAETVADVLEEVRHGQGKTIALALKDRAAILPGGKRPDLALWYDDSARGFTTSAYYETELPPWLVEWQGAHPMSRHIGVWEPLEPARYLSALGPDSAPGEGNWLGLGATFPHDVASATDPYEAFLATPASTDWLIELARECVSRFGLGDDDVPDLLMLSIASTDYAGHVFGPDSWEAADNLVRSDRALGVFVRELEAMTDIAVLITADHGVAPLPERAASGVEGRARPARLFGDDLARELEAAADAALGQGDWVAAYVQPFVYFTDRARVPAVRGRVESALVTALRRNPAVAAAFPTHGLRRGAGRPMERAVAESIPPGTRADLYVVQTQGVVVDEDMPRGFGTSHGSPWDYDTDVPVLFFGAGVRRVTSREPLSQRRVASTLAALLGIRAPRAADPAPLDGVEP